MVVERSVAEKEVEAWLDKKKVFSSVRESNKDSSELLIDGICEGVLTLNERGEFVHNLLFPLGEEEKIEKLTYRARLNDKMLRPYLVGVKSNDGDGRLLAHIAALTTQPREILANLDSVDKKISMAIAVFFL